VTIDAFIRRQGASEDAINNLLDGYNSESAQDFMRDLSSHQAPKLFKISGGNDLLPRAFARHLSDNIIYGARVVQIDHRADGVQLTYVQSGVRHTMAGDYLVCTLPFTILRGIEVTPAFSDRKQKAIRNMVYGSVSRVYMQTRRRFWEDEGSTGFAQVDRFMEIWNPTWNQPGKRGILMNYAYESLAKEIEAQPPGERISTMLDYFEKVFPGMKENVETASSWVWNEQPFAKGAYCVYQAGQLHSMLPVAMAPEGRVLFAGEHCSSHPGWIQGALESGLRAAAEVRQATA
jgi:monoamine oxidase